LSCYDDRKVASLLEDALSRAQLNPDITEIANKMSLIKAHAGEILKILPPNAYPDVIYLDPMFPQRTKSALVKKEMRLIKDLVGEDQDADQLLTIALKVARKRIVVKRPRIAEFLGGIKPHSSQIGKANRFDIYMPISATDTPDIDNFNTSC
jgi:16S rRNA (guanine1516-N2)-methyltransferase